MQDPAVTFSNFFILLGHAVALFSHVLLLAHLDGLHLNFLHTVMVNLFPFLDC